MINIPIWLLVLLIATNIFVLLLVLMLVYVFFGVIDLIYTPRRKPTKDERNCPNEIESDDK